MLTKILRTTQANQTNTQELSQWKLEDTHASSLVIDFRVLQLISVFRFVEFANYQFASKQFTAK